MTPATAKRIAALEGPAERSRSACELSDDELLAILAPSFDGRVPTDEELRRLIDDAARGAT